jgi:hypothetical protein
MFICCIEGLVDFLYNWLEGILLLQDIDRTDKNVIYYLDQNLSQE